MIRPVQLSDATQLVEIYNHYITDTVATFEEKSLTVEEFQQRIEVIRSCFPYIVFEDNGKILGYAYANTFRERVAYRFTVETSVYVRHDLFRSGVGSALYTVLLEQLKQQEFHIAIGGITLPNDQSIAFHEKFGYKKIGHFNEVGKKFGQWHDVGFWELHLS